MVNPMTEQFLIDQIVCHSQTYKRFDEKENEIGFYEHLEALRVSKGLGTQDEALDYAIAFTEGVVAA